MFFKESQVHSIYSTPSISAHTNACAFSACPSFIIVPRTLIPRNHSPPSSLNRGVFLFNRLKDLNAPLIYMTSKNSKEVFCKKNMTGQLV